MASLASAYKKLISLSKAFDKAEWAVSEQVRYLHEHHHQSFRQIAKRIGKSHVWAHDLYHAAKYPVRRKDASPGKHVITAKSLKRVERAIQKETGEPYEMDRARALDEVIKGDFPRVRPATDHLKKLARADVAPKEKKKSIAIARKSPGVIDRCHPCDWREVITKMKPGSVRFWWLDPPYANYNKHGDGHLDVYGSSSCDLVGCHNATTVEAIRECVDCFRLLGPLTHKNGIMALWQRGSLPPSVISKAAEDHGWIALPPYIWDKHSPQPTDFESPTYSTEFCWLFHREGAHISNFDGSSRQQVLSAKDFPPMNGTKRHIMQKPECLSTFMIEKLTRECDIVAELFGCSGSGSRSALKLNRHWVYCESLKENFEFGEAEIEKVLREHKGKGKRKGKR